MKMVISITDDGMKFIYHDELRGLLAQGDATVKRASRVEPGDPARGHDPHKWFADMLPSGSPDFLGPFDTRKEALAAEVEWINKNLLQGALS